MGLAQMSALTGGKRYKRPYVEEINNRTKYLPSLYSQRKQDAYQGKMYGLQKEQAAQNREFGVADLALREDALDEQKKAQKRANTLGYANLGLGGALGFAGLANDAGWFDPAPAAVETFDPSNIIDLSPVKDITDSLPFTSGAEKVGDLAPSLGPVAQVADSAVDAVSDSGSFWKNLFDFGGGGDSLFDSVASDYISVGQY